MATKVFVGNLSFSTTIETLRKEFGAAGNVLNANIITRGPRSLGYGFVELESAEAADKAVKLLHHKDLDGRTINVEVARPRPEGDERPQHEEGGVDGDKPRKRRTRKPRTEGEGSSSPSTSGAEGASTSTRPAGGRGGRGGRRYSQHGDEAGGEGEQQPRTRVRKTYRPREDGAAGQAGEGGDASPQGEGGARRGGRGRGRGPRTTFQPKGTRTANGEGAQTSGGEESAPRTRKPRQPRQPKRQEESRVPSETTLFVANLPFATTDEQLKALFSTAAPVASAHVVTRKNGKSKGFGFVEFATKEHQEAALKATDGSEVEGRKLNVKVALKAPPTDGAGASGSTSDAAASTSSSSASSSGEAAASKPAEPAKTEAKPAEGDKTSA